MTQERENMTQCNKRPERGTWASGFLSELWIRSVALKFLLKQDNLHVSLFDWPMYDLAPGVRSAQIIDYVDKVRCPNLRNMFRPLWLDELRAIFASYII